MMKKWLFLQTVTYEILSFYILFSESPTGLIWLLYIAVHGVACISFTIACWSLLPDQYSLPITSSTAFIFGLSFLMPLFGMLGMLSSILIALYHPRKQNLVTWVEHDPSPLSQHSNELSPLQYGSGALREILINNTNPERRLDAVSAVRYLARHQAIQLLQLALKDLSDDVRLLAYASLESIEAEINDSIYALKKQYLYKKTASKAFGIAQQYWELCYLGLAESALRSHYLKQATLYLLQANHLEENASNNLLLGRIMLEQSNPQGAITYLTLALNGGLLKTQVFPYLAEATYSMGNYKMAKQYIAQFPARKGDKLNQIKAYWL
ncbi:MAG: hypothetical protein ACI808_001091 [Paraglaciecola sp.]|jgi:hypothetical protein